MKDYRNTSGRDVSSTGRTSQSLTNSAHALRTTSFSNSGLCRSSHNKISQNTLALHVYFLLSLFFFLSPSYSLFFLCSVSPYTICLFSHVTMLSFSKHFQQGHIMKEQVILRGNYKMSYKKDY